MIADDCPAPCVERVQHRLIRHLRYEHRRRERHELYFYERHPLPWCTWGPETGPQSPGNPQWRGPRYRNVNPSSGAAGKYQIMPGTWLAVGGTGNPADARIVVQERIARRVARVQGLGAWVNC